MIRQSLSVDGRKIIEFDQPLGQASVWAPAPGARLIISKTAHITATGVVSITYDEVDDDTCAIASVAWDAWPAGDANAIIDFYARRLAERFPA